MKRMNHMKTALVCFVPKPTTFMSFMAFMVSGLALVLAQQVPTFRTRIEVVQLDVSVLDKNRHPVRGLTEQDFTVLEDGKPQRIVGFSTFDIDDTPQPAAGWMRDVPADVTTNVIKESRLFVLVLDDGMIPQQFAFIRDTKKIALSIIDKLGPDDLMAVIFTADNGRTQDFTNDKTKLRATVDQFKGGMADYRFGIDTMGMDVDMSFYLSSVRALSSIADYLIAVPNRRKAVFWVSPGVAFDIEEASPRSVTSAQGFSKPLSATIDMRDLAARTEEVYKKAQLANVTIYPIDPTGLDGLETMLDQRLPRDPRTAPMPPYFGEPQGLDETALNLMRRSRLITTKSNAMLDFLAQTASSTGGRAIINTNDFEPGIGEIFDENAFYYLIGYAPANAVADGSFRRIEVKVNRPDVTVRTRNKYYAPSPEKPDKPGKKPKNLISPEAAELANAVGGLLPSTGLPMKVAVAPFALPGQRVSTVTIVLGVRQPAPAEAAKFRTLATTELQITAFTPEGDPRGTQRQTATVALRAGADGEAAYEILGRIDLPPGRYRLRLGAVNAKSSKSGSVFTDVIVPDYANVSFSASPIVLRLAPGPVAAPVELLADLLPFTPTAEREFTRADSVTSLVRLYQDGKQPAKPVQVSISIRDADDRVKVTTSQEIRADQFLLAREQFLTDTPTVDAKGKPLTAPQDTVPYTLRTADVLCPIPFSKLTPGPHLMTFELRLGETTLRRDVRFEVK